MPKYWKHGLMTAAGLVLLMVVWVQARENTATSERVEGPTVIRLENPPVDPPSAPPYVVSAGRSPLMQEGENLAGPIPYVLGRPVSVTGASSSSATSAAGIAIPWQEAGQHVGKTITVEGRIVDTYFHTSSQNTFLNFSRDRSGTFYLIMFREMLNQYPETPDQYFRNKTVRVTGRITERDGRPQIQVRSKDQIEIVN